MKTYKVSHNVECRRRIFEEPCDEQDDRTEKFMNCRSDEVEKMEKLAAQRQEGQEAASSSDGKFDKEKEAGREASVQAEAKEA